MKYLKINNFNHLKNVNQIKIKISDNNFKILSIYLVVMI